MRFKNLYIKKKIKNNLNLWYDLKKNYLNSFYLNFFFKYFFVFNFNSYNSFNWHFFYKFFLNFFDISLFKINNFSKKKILALLKKKMLYNVFGSLFFINFTSLYSKFDFLNNLNIVSANNNIMFRFKPVLLSLGNNFTQLDFFLKKKNFIFFMNKGARFKIFIISLKFLFKYYFNFILLTLFNYLNMFFAFFYSCLNKFLFKFLN